MNLIKLPKALYKSDNKNNLKAIFPSLSLIFFILGILIVSCSQEEKSMDSVNVSESSQNTGITKYQLDNGLTVILEENNASPVVSVNVWVKTGSACEVEGEYGLAHVHEHMLFKQWW